MKDDLVGEALRGLPRDEASPDFTARTVSLMDGDVGPRRRRPALYLALLLLVIGLGLGTHRAREIAVSAARLADLEEAREEVAALQVEYQRLLELEAESPRFVHVNLAEDVDLVLDLSAWSSAVPGGPVAQPAVYRPKR